MSTKSEQATGRSLGQLPRVNLLPPEIEQARRFKKVQLGLGAGVLGAVAVVGALTVLATASVGTAQEDLDASKAEGVTLQGQVAKYADVPVVAAKVDAAQAQLALAMGQEVRWSYFLNDLSLTVPGKVWLTSVNVVQNVDTASVPAVVSGAGTTYLTPGIASVTFAGTAYKHSDVASWLDALARQKGVSQPYFTNSTKQEIAGEDAVTFASQATVTDDLLSHRWTQKASS
jgi:Tfp pilus assembly protein PilN